MNSPQGSFAGAWSSEPLYAISPRLPFLVALCLTLFSFSASLLYALVEWRGSNGRARAGRKDAAHHQPLRLSTLAYFGSPFWWYMGVCALAGTWYTTEHLSSHLLQSVYSIPEAEASPAAALVLGAPLLVCSLEWWLTCRWLIPFSRCSVTLSWAISSTDAQTCWTSSGSLCRLSSLSPTLATCW